MRPLVSCLCVTEGRRAFMPWLAWNYEKQTYPDRELVIVDSSIESDTTAGALPPILGADGVRTDVRVVRARPGTTIGAKRNIALREASGSIVCWFDDDDWQHPNRVTTIVQTLTQERPLAGNRTSYLLNLASGMVARHTWPAGVLFNGAGFTRSLATSLAFHEDARTGEDTRYMMRLMARRLEPLVIDVPLSFWLSHDRNVSNSERSRSFPLSRVVLREVVGSAWDDTDDALDRLKLAVGGG